MRRSIVLILLLAGCNLNATNLPTSTPAPLLPRVEFIMPTEGDRVVEGFDLTIDLVAQDDAPGAGVARVEILINDQLLIEAEPEEGNPVPTFRVETNWITEGTGKHVLSATAYRRDGTQSDTRFITLEVVGE